MTCRAVLLCAAVLSSSPRPAWPTEAGSSPAPVAAPATLACDSAFAQPMVLWPADRSFQAVEVQNVRSAPGDEVRIEVTGVRQNEMPMAAGEEGGKNPRSRHCPDASIRPGGRIELRAERLAEGQGRLYVVAFRARARSGESCTGEVLVRVPLEKGKQSENAPTRRDATYDSTRCD